MWGRSWSPKLGRAGLPSPSRWRLGTPRTAPETQAWSPLPPGCGLTVTTSAPGVKRCPRRAGWASSCLCLGFVGHRPEGELGGHLGVGPPAVPPVFLGGGGGGFAVAAGVSWILLGDGPTPSVLGADAFPGSLRRPSGAGSGDQARRRWPSCSSGNWRRRQTSQVPQQEVRATAVGPQACGGDPPPGRSPSPGPGG